jgi:diguanylate cyclase (GGDEF)-like protein/PAS domain S-box-containing protein
MAATLALAVLVLVLWDQVSPHFIRAALAGLAAFFLLWLVLGHWGILRQRQPLGSPRQIEDRYRGMIEQTSDIIHIVSPDGKFLYVNRAWRQTFGYSAEEVADLTLMDLLHPEERAKASQQIRRLMVEKHVIQIDTRFVTKDGRVIWAEGNSTCELRDGVVVSRRGIFRNVTERKRAESERSQLLAILEEAPDFIATFTLGRNMLWANRAFRRLRDLPDDFDFAQLKISDFQPQWATEMTETALSAVLAQGIWEGESAVLTRESFEVPVSQTIVAHHDESGSVAYFSTLCRDITDRQRAEQALREAHAQLNQALERERELARTDVLTRLSNRRAFYEAAENERQRSLRHGHPLTLAYVDVDNFKKVNDTLGHATGDELLVTVADGLRQHLRASDTVGRLGGDEFAILLPETTAQGAESVVRKLSEVLLQEMKSRHWPVSFSIGVATFLHNPPSLDEMIRSADELMYTVKRDGKNKIAVVLIGGSAHESEKAISSEA